MGVPHFSCFSRSGLPKVRTVERPTSRKEREKWGTPGLVGCRSWPPATPGLVGCRSWPPAHPYTTPFRAFGRESFPTGTRNGRRSSPSPDTSANVTIKPVDENDQLG
jgi:hypothetical protein